MFRYRSLSCIDEIYGGTSEVMKVIISKSMGL